MIEIIYKFHQQCFKYDGLVTKALGVARSLDVVEQLSLAKGDFAQGLTDVSTFCDVSAKPQGSILVC